MSEESRYVWVRAKCVRTSPKGGVLVIINRSEYWIPQSQIHDDSEVYTDDGVEGKLVMTRWIADKKGLIEQCKDHDAE